MDKVCVCRMKVCVVWWFVLEREREKEREGEMRDALLKMESLGEEFVIQSCVCVMCV